MKKNQTKLPKRCWPC